METDNKYPDFACSATELSAYTLSVGIFIIALKNGQLIHFTPIDVEAFTNWLSANHIRDIRKDRGHKSL